MRSNIHTINTVSAGTTTRLQETKNTIIDYALQSKTNEVIKCLANYNRDLNDIVDNSGRNLLHICAATNNGNLMKHLLMLNKVDKSKIDAYGDTPLCIAMKNHNKCMYNMLTGVDNLDYYIAEKDKLTDKVKILNELNYELTQSNTIFSRENDRLADLNKKIQSELSNERVSLKRLREENETLSTENKRFKTDNACLQKTVQGYTNSMRKK